MVLFFSGTGNSRYIAMRIADALQDTVVDLNAKIKANDYLPIETGNNVIIVAPTYAWRIPRIVTSWISRTQLKGAKRIWYVMSCGGEIGNAAKYNRILAEQKHLQYMGTAQIIMPENYIAMFGVPETDEAIEIIKNAEPDIRKAVMDIREEQSFALLRNNFYGQLMSGFVNHIFYLLFVRADAFRAGNTCSGCGLCASKCPMNNIRIKEGKPVWGTDCTHCMACISYCPVEAAEYGRKSIGKPRYSFEKLEYLWK